LGIFAGPYRILAQFVFRMHPRRIRIPGGDASA
jgi:hypothetical protein